MTHSHPARWASALVAAAIAVGQPLAAATGDGSEVPGARIPAWEASRLKENSPALATLFRAAVCFKVVHTEQARLLLATRRHTEAEEAIYDALTANREDDRKHCYWARKKGVFRWRSPALMRGAIAEAFYNGDRLRPRSAAPLAIRQSFESVMGSLEVADATQAPSWLRAETVGYWMALCTAHKAPLQVHALLRFKPAAPGETRALNALRETFESCLPEDRKLETERLTTRALLAESLYQVAMSHPEAFR